MHDKPLRVLIVSEYASARFGGEAGLPWYYFRILRRRGLETWLVVHARTKDELLALRPDDAERMHFVPDSWFDRLAWRLSQYLPDPVAYITFGYASRLKTQRAMRKLVRRLVAEKGIDVVHQPIPVSPREPSLIYGVGAPVVMGPMNGNINFPPGFLRKKGKLLAVGAVIGVARGASSLLHLVMPGKRRAAALLVANDRTRQALPKGTRGEVVMLPENGVELDVWFPADRQTQSSPAVRFIFVGRLVDWKAVNLLLEAFARVDAQYAIRMEIVGDGPERAALEALASSLGIADRVHFAGWQSQPECAARLRGADALILPSLCECGGAVVLEAMACGLPVIATDWGGPADYLNATCGILVPPDSRAAFTAGLTAAMTRLAANPALRAELGRAGRQRVEEKFDWERKVDAVISVYQRVVAKK